MGVSYLGRKGKGKGEGEGEGERSVSTRESGIELHIEVWFEVERGAVSVRHGSTR